MDFTTLSSAYVTVVMLACLIIGYLIKTGFDFIPNKYIPTILACVGVLVNVIASGLSLDSVVYGAFMGLASTGMHQAFTKFIEKE